MHNIKNRFAEEQRIAAKRVRAVFGEEAANFCSFVFTNVDLFERKCSTIEEYVNRVKPDSRLKEVLDDYGGRYIAVNNDGTNFHKEEVLDKLLILIQQMLLETTDRFYSTYKFKKVADVVDKSKAQGHVIIDIDGSIVPIPEVKKIMGSYLCRNLGKNSLAN